MGIRPTSKASVDLWTWEKASLLRRTDSVAVEEPLEIRLRAGRDERVVAITMRTPGSDFELAAGFLYGEGIVRDARSIRSISYCVDRVREEEQLYNIVTVDLAADRLPDFGGLERHFLTTSACGVCGRASLETLRDRGCQPLSLRWTVPAALLPLLPGRLGSRQGIFRSTGGLHAAGLFTRQGELIALREDVGRHNAMDKLIGWALLQNRLPLSDCLVLVSGRASYELLQKALAAGLPVFCAVSAPSSLAVRLAREFALTLVGFLRGERFNIYAGQARILASDAPCLPRITGGA
ncbi:formate dehydrogenase accessory sulfurtransferase FdhD [Methylacidimicrobium sp. B4]|uniref:formate dehydrogenase accessory sulfurtransferase FdhD n=1 Tax=Methylacidimicrobium sp. B4 TaxID=2796139 RepID=UPI001A8FABB3|nr:formate dehydrogenase accessory sulfurtransferase FdhD [Methylacidimicrobium sp. B4]QSR84728.1 formate dehydrogenase accessory sulfurtransferase FdhD [Methylacidimicrobium sp. B4]